MIEAMDREEFCLMGCQEKPGKRKVYLGWEIKMFIDCRKYINRRNQNIIVFSCIQSIECRVSVLDDEKDLEVNSGELKA